MTPKQLSRIQELLEDRLQCHLVVGVEGSLTCDGMAIEFPLGVMHPLAFLALIDGPEFEMVDILKRHAN